ncbi:MAG: pyridoxine 5'-phosphate synthase [Gammaproteobacteria bacterium]|nr:pyridoxine 5'-phosphate synthase [Gammaproteobacteria bacterium]MYD75390.1 pyridoxine 5'-phosphate synthase [Gammaproteobacteria bacterium]MYJ52791.1 pyridoxine 5'-phosphate synthase [Gammaproteobacteria bacterium]
MTRLSVNLNKIALLRNSRGRDYPSVAEFARRFIDLGVDGITVHPRQDERHTRRRDVYDLARVCESFANVEFNIEGYPSEDFLAMVGEVGPDQCTLVPDAVDQITSDHGWDVEASKAVLVPVLERLRNDGVRSSLFVDPVPGQVSAAARIGADRIELYTESYAVGYHGPDRAGALAAYRKAADAAHAAGIGVNAGHDLDLDNLAEFLGIGGILEVSIGHALTVECIEHGMENVIRRYLRICHETGT